MKKAKWKTVDEALDWMYKNKKEEELWALYKPNDGLSFYTGVLELTGALICINAAVVGILLAALYNPLCTTAILPPVDFALAAFCLLCWSSGKNRPGWLFY
ncbi:hypothetical protein J6TS7_34600 [Paenibacillus dendritiformis]|nr:hypothetical protein J6TS7_34600 [Paenibacillus dendritiformis]